MFYPSWELWPRGASGVVSTCYLGVARWKVYADTGGHTAIIRRCSGTTRRCSTAGYVLTLHLTPPLFHTSTSLTHISHPDTQQAIRQTVRIIAMDHPQGVLRTGDRATVTFEFISRPEFLKEGMKLLFREGKTKVRSSYSEPSCFECFDLYQRSCLGLSRHETQDARGLWYSEMRCADEILLVGQCRVSASSRSFYDIGTSRVLAS